MPSNSEMYDRGALDAEHDDLNAFYYQHYYYYRKGYDDSRRQIRGSIAVLFPPWLMPMLGILALVIAVAGGAYWLVVPRDDIGDAGGTPSTASSAAAAQSTALSITPTRPAPTATVVPTPPPAIQVGGRARVVNIGDSTLRARSEPGLAGSIRIVARFPEGSEVTIIEGPSEADGLIWWRIGGDAGEGWSAERSADDVVFLEPLP